MPVIVSGKTWDLRHWLSLAGGVWNREKRHWEFHTLSKEHRDIFKAHDGVIISDTDAPVIPPYHSPRTTPLTKVKPKGKQHG